VQHVQGRFADSPALHNCEWQIRAYAGIAAMHKAGSVSVWFAPR
jgi:hypothetical protein